MKQPLFGYLMTAMITPFDEENNINFAVVDNLVEHLVETGTDTLVIAGTTGESPALSFNEKISLFKHVKHLVGDACKVMAGTGCNNTLKTIQLTQAAQEVGVDGAMVVVPYYNKPPQNALFQHFSKVAKETDLPVMVYNVPGRTSKNLEPETIARLSEIENIVAIKEASGSLDQVSSINRLCGGQVDIYSGDDSLTLPILAVGGMGVVSVASHIVGQGIKDMIMAYHNGEVKVAQRLHLELYSAFKGLFFTTNPIPVKAAMNLLGFDVGNLRMPLLEATTEELRIVQSLLDEYNL